MSFIVKIMCSASLGLILLTSNLLATDTEERLRRFEIARKILASERRFELLEDEGDNSVWARRKRDGQMIYVSSDKIYEGDSVTGMRLTSFPSF